MQANVRVHIIHAQHLTNRVPLVNAIIQTLKPVCKQVEIVADKDPGMLSAEDIRLFANKPVPEPDLAYFNGALKPMSVTAISNAMKHRIALSQASEDPSCIHLVLEDDSMITNEFVEKLGVFARTYQSNSVLFLGVPLKPNGTDMADVFDTYAVVPSCDSYLIDAGTAKILLQEYVADIRFGTNIQMTYAAKKHKVDLKAASPTISIDGSKMGLFASTIEVNNRLVYNGHFLRLSALINKQDDLTEEELKMVDEMFTAVDHKMNPEFFYLKAKLENRKKNYDYALALFQQAYKLYDSLGTPLTQGSDFMRDYMKMHIHFQD